MMRAPCVANPRAVSTRGKRVGTFVLEIEILIMHMAGSFFQEWSSVSKCSFGFATGFDLARGGDADMQYKLCHTKVCRSSWKCGLSQSKPQT